MMTTVNTPSNPLGQAHLHLAMLLRCGTAVAALLFGLSNAVQAQTSDAGAVDAAAVSAALDSRFAQAMDAYERNHWQQAYEQFAQLGMAGHEQAARIALQMSRYGLQLYGVRFTASPKERARWLHVAGCSRWPAVPSCQPTLVAR